MEGPHDPALQECEIGLGGIGIDAVTRVLARGMPDHVMTTLKFLADPAICLPIVRHDRGSALDILADRALAGVADVRAFGAIGVVELDEMRGLDWLRARFIDEGIWLRPFGNTVYTMPALVISPTDLTRVTDAMVKIIAEWSRKFA